MVRYAEFGTHHPLRDWLTQRLTAVVMAFYSVAFLITLLVMPPVSYSLWHQIFLLPWIKFTTLLFFVSLCLHAWVGMRNICMDYVNYARTRLLLYVWIISMLVLYMIWAAQILWQQ